jgi:hypothetical protein
LEREIAIIEGARPALSDEIPAPYGTLLRYGGGERNFELLKLLYLFFVVIVIAFSSVVFRALLSHY